MLLLSFVVCLAAFGALLWLATCDVRYRRLPTQWVLAIGALYFVNALMLHLPLKDVFLHVLLALLVLLICAGLYAAKVLGGGDAKLASITFLWAGPGLALISLTLISLIGTLVALLSIATRNMNQNHRSQIMRIFAMFSGARGVPYGVAIALGGGTVILLPALLRLLLTR